MSAKRKPKKPLFHYARGFGKYTLCGIKTREWGAKWDPKNPGPNWGGCITEGTTCKRCIVNAIADWTFELEHAIKQLRRLTK